MEQAGRINSLNDYIGLGANLQVFVHTKISTLTPLSVYEKGSKIYRPQGDREG